MANRFGIGLEACDNLQIECVRRACDKFGKAPRLRHFEARKIRRLLYRLDDVGRPLVELFVFVRAVGTHESAVGYERENPRRADFDRLADDVVEDLSLGHTLGEKNARLRLAYFDFAQNVKLGAFSVGNRNFAVLHTARQIENVHFVARLCPQRTAKVAAFVAAFEKFDEALKDSEKLASSALVTKADDARDYAWRGVSNYLKAMTMHPDADVAAAAVEGEELVDKYGDPTNLSYTAESGTLHNFLQDLEAIPSEKRTLLGIDPWTARLRKENDAFLLAIQQKAEEKDAREVGVVKEARQEADEAYRAMVDTINVVANLEEGTTYDAFIGAVNQHIETQKTTLKSRATRNKNKKDEKPEEEEPDDRPVVQ